MKTFTFFTLMTFISLMGYSQYSYVAFISAGQNPGGLNTDNEFPQGGANPPPGWTQISTATNTAPVWNTAQTIPFAFSFNGNPVTQYMVSSSAILTFDVGTALPAPAYTQDSLPDASIPDKSVCIWGLAGIGVNDYIVTKTFGASPNQQLWIQFSSYGYGTATPSDGSNYTYWAIVLEETTNKIYIVDQRTGGFAGANMVSTGIQINSTTAFPVSGSPNLSSTAGSNQTPADNSYYEFTADTNAGVHENPNPGDFISIYPNPVKERVNIHLDKQNNADIHLQIMDVQGKIVFDKNTRGLNNYINLSHIHSGLYFVKASYDGKIFTSKLVKE